VGGLRDDAAGFPRKRVARLDRVDEPPAARTGGLQPARIDPAREPERRNDLEDRGGFPTAGLLGAEMEDPSVLAAQPAGASVVGRPVSPAVEPLDLDLLGARIGPDDHALAEKEE